MKPCTCGLSGSVWCPGANCCAPQEDEGEPDVCVHGRGWDETCIECCPEDVDDYTDYE